MKFEMIKRSLIAAACSALAAGLLAPPAGAQEAAPELDADLRAHAGRALAYQQLERTSLETVTTPERLLRVAQGGYAPTEIWRALEHGEKVECLNCIPAVSKLLFSDEAKTREISAWWLRRRIFGVFGPGEVYSRLVATVGDPTQSEKQRAYAADALGEFLTAAGVAPVARAAVNDPSPLVRRSAVRALLRLNTAGPGGELGLALSDPDEQVRLAALHASIRVNVFRDVASVAARLDDASSAVRTRALEALGALRAQDAVVAIVAKLQPENEPQASVRAAAAAALGELGAREALESVRAAAETDPDHFVRDAAAIALRRL
jgi:HEAT repeat protein